MNYQQARQIRKDFVREYLVQYGDRVRMCNLIAKWQTREWVIVVYSSQQLDLPVQYQGLRVEVRK